MNDNMIGGVSLDSAALSVAQIAALLEQQEIQPALIACLQNDSRKSVAVLLSKWLRRQEQREAEIKSLRARYAYEEQFLQRGCKLIAGVDEAGRGPLAGPVVIGAVILPPGLLLPGVDDSKKLSPQRRRALYQVIYEKALAVQSVVVDVEQIDRLNIYQATMRGMYQAIAALGPQPDGVLSDAMPLTELTVPVCAIKFGDALSLSIAAASIVAKVERDRLMEDYDRMYPEYGFAKHKGYGTKEHLAAIGRYGPCAIHRKSFEPIKGMVAERTGVHFQETLPFLS